MPVYPLAFAKMPGYDSAVMAEAICVTPLRSRYSLLPRLHMYACFIAASFYRPSHGSVPLKVALVTFLSYLVLAVADVWETALRLFGSPETCGVPDVGLTTTCRMVILTLYYCCEHLEWFTQKGKGTGWRESLGPYYKHGLLAVLLATGFAGTVAQGKLRHMAARMPPGDGIACTSQHGVNMERGKFLFRTGVNSVDAMNSAFGPTMLHPELAHVSLKILLKSLALLLIRMVRRKRISDKKGVPPDSNSTHGDVEKDGSTRADAGGKARLVVRKARFSPWVAWLFNWRSFPLSRLICSEIYYISLGPAADPHIWSLSHWVIWGGTAVYLSVLAGRSFLRGRRELRAEKETAQELYEK